jgi:hypothetical protein
VSPGASAGNLAGLLAGRRADPLAYRRVFRDRWGAFLRANFHNPLHVAVFFSVDESTARKWWNDVNEPQGWVVAVAVATHPKALPMLLEDAA